MNRHVVSGFLLSCAATLAAQDKDAAGVLARHPELLEKPGVVQLEGYAFATAMGRLGNRRLEMAVQLLRMSCLQQFLDSSLVIEPLGNDQLDKQFDSVIRSLLKAEGQAVTVKGLETLHADAKDQVVCVVQSIPVDALPIRNVSRAEGVELVCAFVEKGSAPLAVGFLACEVAPEAQTEGVVAAMLAVLGPVSSPDAVNWPAWALGRRGADVEPPLDTEAAVKQLKEGATSASMAAAVERIRSAGYERTADAVLAQWVMPERLEEERSARLLADIQGVESSLSGSEFLVTWLHSVAAFGEQHPTNLVALDPSAILRLMDAGQWGAALERLVSSPSRSSEWFQLASVVLSELKAPESSAVCSRIAAENHPENVDLQLDRIAAEVRTAQWEAAERQLERMLTLEGLSLPQRVRLAQLGQRVRDR